MPMRDVNINILTCRRCNADYLPNTLDSLKRSDWSATTLLINLVLGSPDESSIEPYRGDDRLRIVPWQMPTPRDLRVAFNLNHARALRLGAADRDCIILEDDIAARSDWLARSALAVAEIEACEDRPFILALYYPFDRYAPATGKYAAPYQPTSFYGTQGMYYTAAVREPLAAYMTDPANISRLGGDLLIGEWAAAHASLYTTRPSLLQHCGRETTGLGHFHRAFDFEDGREPCVAS
jgi:hypothetical protein